VAGNLWLRGNSARRPRRDLALANRIELLTSKPDRITSGGKDFDRLVEELYPHGLTTACSRHKQENNYQLGRFRRIEGPQSVR
jgi:hypothetical protein